MRGHRRIEDAVAALQQRVCAGRTSRTPVVLPPRTRPGRIRRLALSLAADTVVAVALLWVGLVLAL